MFKDMNKASYKQCNGWKEIPIEAIQARKPKTMVELSDEQLSMREERLLKKTELSTGFKAFLNKGGHWSLNVDNNIK